jgi:hypothetical protein
MVTVPVGNALGAARTSLHHRIPLRHSSIQKSILKWKFSSSNRDKVTRPLMKNLFKDLTSVGTSPKVEIREAYSL